MIEKPSYTTVPLILIYRNGEKQLMILPIKKFSTRKALTPYTVL